MPRSRYMTNLIIFISKNDPQNPYKSLKNHASFFSFSEKKFTFKKKTLLFDKQLVCT
jgi:hypothetical protein